MRTYEVFITNNAKSDIRAIYGWIANKNPAAAQRWLDGLEEHLQNLSHMPLKHKYTASLGLMAHARVDVGEAGDAAVPWIKASAGYSYTDARMERKETAGTTATANVDAHAIRLEVSAGQDIKLSEQARVTPLAGLEYTYIRQEGYEEKGATTPITGKSMETNFIRPYIGMEAAVKPAKKWELTASAAYHYEMKDTEAKLEYSLAGVSGIPLRSEKRGRHSGTLGIGVSYGLTGDTSITGDYRATAGHRYNGHEFRLMLKTLF